MNFENFFKKFTKNFEGGGKIQGGVLGWGWGWVDVGGWGGWAGGWVGGWVGLKPQTLNKTPNPHLKPFTPPPKLQTQPPNL